jgi:hypothetical protein
MPSDPGALLRSRSYLQLLAIAAILGVPVSAAAYGFLALVNYLQQEIFTHLPHGLGFHAQPVWWPLPVLAVGGVLAGLAIRYLPGNGGASPADGFKVHGPPTPVQLPGVMYLTRLLPLVIVAVVVAYVAAARIAPPPAPEAAPAGEPPAGAAVKDEQAAYGAPITPRG